ncbi:MAG: FmdB family zinc ribbon protein [Nitrospirota bacterium]
MPIYEYRCESCDNYFALFKHNMTGDDDTACPNCGSQKVKKQLSSFSCSMPDGGGSSTGGSFSGGFSGGG